jgi:hypothetical protein
MEGSGHPRWLWIRLSVRRRLFRVPAVIILVALCVVYFVAGQVAVSWHGSGYTKSFGTIIFTQRNGSWEWFDSLDSGRWPEFDRVYYIVPHKVYSNMVYQYYWMRRAGFAPVHEVHEIRNGGSTQVYPSEQAHILTLPEFDTFRPLLGPSLDSRLPELQGSRYVLLPGPQHIASERNLDTNIARAVQLILIPLIAGVLLRMVVTTPAERAELRKAENRCGKCGYPCSGLTGDLCPECGGAL